MKLMTVVAASVCAVSLSARAADTSKPAESEETPIEEKETALFSYGADLDFFSAYVWRNAVQNDEMVMQPCVWVDFNGLDPLTIGGFIWQNYDLSDRRGNIYRYGLNETDYNIHLGYTAWTSEDEDFSLGLELGHEWYTYHGVRDSYDETFLRNEYPDTRELYFKLAFDNPFVNVYGQSSWMYGEFGNYKTAMHYELGFNKEVELVEEILTAGIDWNVNFGNHRYLEFLYGGVSKPYWEENEDGDMERFDDYAGAPDAGIGGTTVKLYSSWQITEWMALKATIAYTGLLNGSLRDSIGEQGDEYWFNYNEGDGYPRDLLWGGLSLNIEF